jgi:hypothetical protein
MIGFTPQPFYPPEKSLRFPLGRSQGEPQNRSGRYGQEKNFLPCREWTPNPMFSSPQPGRYIDWSIPAQLTEYIIKISRFLSIVITQLLAQ